MGDTYATHLPVLRALAKCVPMRRVLEIGAGDYSTPFFLSLPLEKLVSVESDPRWRERVATDDPRHEVVEAIPESDFDFIFVDNGSSVAERVETIRTVLTKPHPVVAVHDAEIDAYAQAIREATKERTLFVCVQTPHTAVVWPEGQAKSRELLRAYDMEEA